MALPTTNLTLHLDASDTDKLFTTWVDGGSHTGTPGDGSAVQAWSRETDGSVNPAHAAYQTGTTAPVYRSSTPLMALPCLDFDGSDDYMVVVGNATVNDNLGANNFVGLSAKTILLAAYFETIASTQTAAQDNDGVIGGASHFGIFVKDSGGTKKVMWTAYDGAWGDVVEQTITTGTTVVICARHDGTNLYLSVDGGSESSIANGATSAEASAITIGRATGGTRMNGRIGEIAVYNAALTGANLTDAIAYFRQKWQGVAPPSSDSACVVAMI